MPCFPDWEKSPDIALPGKTKNRETRNYYRLMINFLIIGNRKEFNKVIEKILYDNFQDSTITTTLTDSDWLRVAVTGFPEIIIVSDNSDPDNGFKICARLRSRFNAGNLPFIVLARDDETKKSRIKALESGADALIGSPLDKDEIRAVVNSLLRKRQSESFNRILGELYSHNFDNFNTDHREKLPEENKTEKSILLAIEKLESSRIASLNLMEDLKEEIEIRKKTEAELRQSEERLRSLFSSMQEGFALHEIICNKEGKPVDYRFLDMNRAFENLTGLVASEVIGRNILSVLPKTEKFWIEEYGKVALNRGETEIEHYSREIKKYFRVRAFSPKEGQFATLFEDITQRREMEKSLQENEEKFRIIFESVGSGIIYMTTKGKIVDVNPAFERLTDSKREELIGINAVTLGRKVLAKYNAPEILKNLVSAIMGKSLSSFPFFLNGKHLSGSTFRSNDGKMIISVITDQTEQVNTERERMELLLRQKTILGAIPDILMEVDNNRVYTWANKAGSSFFGKDVIGKSADHFFAGIQDTLSKVEPIFRGDDSPVYVESWQHNNRGEKKLLAWWCKSLKNNEGEVVGAISSARDITEIKNKETELEKSRKQLEQLNLYQQRIREEERKIISRELHDDLGQLLTAVKIDLGSLRLSINDPQLMAARIDKISALIGESIITVKRLTSQLRPHILDDLGLLAAIEWYTSEFQGRTGIKVSLGIDQDIELPVEYELVIFRIIQESITNITKHSGAKNICINFKRKKRRIILEVDDDGKGFELTTKRSDRSFGLLSMKERAKEIGGTLEIESEPGSGTRIRLTISQTDTPFTFSE